MTDLHVGMVMVDQRLQIARADERFYEYIGFENYVSLMNVIHPDDLGDFKKTLEGLSAGGCAMLVARLRRGDGKYHDMLMDFFGLPLKNETEHYVEIKVWDVGELEEDYGRMRDENRICNEFLDLWGEYLFRYDAAQDFFRIFSGGGQNRVMLFQGTIGQFERTVLQKGLVGEAYRSDFRNFCADVADGTKNFEYRLLLQNQDIDPQHDVHVLCGKTVQNRKQEPVVVGYIRCQSDLGGKNQYVRKNYEKDVTTGLFTKKSVTEYAEGLLRKKPQYNINFCVVDIDNFKQVNDTLGHLYGDRVLAEVADIIQEAVAGKGLVGRIGGDEIFIVLERVATLDNLRGILRSIRSNVEWTYRKREGVPAVTCSIGVSTYPGDATNYGDLFKIADKMLYRAKEKGKNRYIVYAPDIHGDVLSEGEHVAGVDGTGGNQDGQELLLNMMECLARQQNQPYGTVLKNIGKVFGLEEVQLFYRDKTKILIEVCWDAGEGLRAMESLKDCLGEENFVHLYKGKNLAVIDRTGLIEQLCPKTYQYLTGHGIKAALVYKMGFLHHEGYIAYCKKSELSRKWSDGDKERLTYISKVVELMLNDK